MGFYRSHKKFLLFLVSQTVSQMGSAMTGLAVVIWAYSSTGQVMASSLLAVCSTLPYLIVSLFGGAAGLRRAAAGACGGSCDLCICLFHTASFHTNTGLRGGRSGNRL